MAGKKNAGTPANYDRWDTIPQAIKVTGKNTPAQQKAINEMNAQMAAKKGGAKKKK